MFDFKRSARKRPVTPWLREHKVTLCDLLMLRTLAECAEPDDDPVNAIVDMLNEQPEASPIGADAELAQL